ncbi:hypothetical protein PRK78_001484 [Emydomyces testavorans]|uniref:Uncharacterized protein n=1 Tax=Emydomyces testavorans TaxID=2070801 RepID=A0AAF0DCM0_9EURO|nr:hypothetical protein PRK78_001484 [Emydomyces testavorans]
MLPLLPFILFQIVSADHLVQQPLNDLFPGSWEAEPQIEFRDEPAACSISHLTAYEQVEGPVAFSTSPTEHLEIPKLSGVNATAWEQWEFDGTDDDGMAGIILGFSRDASYAFFGLGNLRVEFYMVLSDGTVIQELDYLEESTVINCDGAVTGIWNSTKRIYSFHVSKDMSRATVKWETPAAQGRLSLNSFAQPHFPDGSIWPSKDAKTEMAPSLHMNQPIAGGRVVADVNISKKKKMQLNGVGGHGRLWAEGGWFKIVDGFHIIRASAGPYTISYWRPISRLIKGVVYQSAQLFKDGQMLAATQLGEESQGKDYVLFSNDFNGKIRGGLTDKSTGHVLEFVSPNRGRRWRFLVEHMRKKFEMGLGGESGLSGFTNRITGGEIGGQQYEGRGFSEQTVFPETIAKWRIWIVYGIGYFNRGKGFLLKVARWLS